MLTQQQNELLCRVGKGTPMGTLMRRYWIPVLFAWELPEPDCTPVSLKVLGEELVAFRDSDGRVGLLDAFCAHRRVNLFWGRNEDNGIRCVYHGWLFDVNGQCTDMPSEPENSNFRDKVHIAAYATVEKGGVIWAYMGPAEQRPADPNFEWTRVPETHRGISKVWQECNWLQGLEGGIDTVHINFLHRRLKQDPATVMARARSQSMAPYLEVVPTEYGYSYAGIRPMGDDGNYVRAYHFIMPWTQLRPQQVNTPRPRVSSHMWVPVDDENTIVWNLTYTFGSAPLTEDERTLRGSGNELGKDIDPTNQFRSYANAGNKYFIDRKAQKAETFSGIPGTNTQDRAVQETMGKIYDRTLERLGTTDLAIIAARRMLLQALKDMELGNDPRGLAPTYYNLRSIEKVLPTDALWFEALKGDMQVAASATDAVTVGG